MIRGPLRCTCCGAKYNQSDRLGPSCHCTIDAYGMGVASCLDCGKCLDHCRCPEGVARDWDEVTRRAAAGTLYHQRIATGAAGAVETGR